MNQTSTVTVKPEASLHSTCWLGLGSTLIFSFKERSASKHHVGFYVKVIHFGFPPTQVDPFFFQIGGLGPGGLDSARISLC